MTGAGPDIRKTRLPRPRHSLDGDMIVIGCQRIRVPTGLQTELTLGASYRVVASRTPDGALVAERITRNEDDPLPPQT